MSLDRRAFLKQSALLGAMAAFPPALRPGLAAALRAPARPVRVRGTVRAAGRGLAGVAVTDGLSVVATDARGAFELWSTGRRPFVYLTVPAGHRIPRHETGTARFYQPIRPDGRGEMTAAFELERLDGSDEHHAFLVLADPQTQDTYETDRLHAETVPDVQATVAALGDVPVFGVACGDIMFDDLSLYPEWERAVARMGVPFFQVVGNHDLDYSGRTDEASTETFRGHFGPTYYSFERGEVHYVVLDDVFWNGYNYLGYLDADQLAWLEQDLARVEAGRTVVVCQHIPVLASTFRRNGERSPGTGVSVTNREALYALLEPFEAHLLSGHTHEQEHVFEGGTHEHVHGAVCGAWWSGEICYDGTPNGYGVYEARGAELRWRYKATGRDADYRLRAYPRGADPAAPDEIVANVWDWDPSWRVFWHEDGVRKGLMGRRTGTDPLAEALHRGGEKPERRPWVEPVRTDHLFYAPTSPDARSVVVEAVDPWGASFRAGVSSVE